MIKDCPCGHFLRNPATQLPCYMVLFVVYSSPSHTHTHTHSHFSLCSVDHPAWPRKSSLNLFSEWCPFTSCSWLGKVWNWTCHNVCVCVAGRLFVLLCVPLTFASKIKHTGKWDRKCLSFHASESMCLTGKSSLRRGWAQCSVRLMARD